MLLVIGVSIIVPLAVALGLTALRSKLPRLVVDTRGIALQTVIIMVVLLAIAGSVAAVLLTRGSDAVDDLDQSSVGPEASEYNNERLCERAGYTWSEGTAATWCFAA